MGNYNQKNFPNGFRGRLSRARFDWLQKNLNVRENAYTLFELGCFDCRSLSFIPKPSRYVGADAGVEGGLEDARMTFGKMPWAELATAHTVHDLGRHKEQCFDYSIALDTLEYIPDAVLRGYIEFLARITQKHLLVAVPVEIGLVFLAKHFAKTIFPSLGSGEEDPYTFAEIYWAALGKAEHVRRFERKGFDYRNLIKLLEQHFHITRVEGIPFRSHPNLSFQVGIIAEPKRKV